MNIKRAILFIATFCFHLLAEAQSTLRFDKTEWDFGIIQETDGVVAHKFWFTNSGSQAVVVERVTTDCGCTTPTYSKEPVRPNERGWIEVAFDPRGAWGELTKTIVVFSNGGKGAALRIKVDVVPRAKTIYENYPIDIGEGVRVTSLSEAFGYMAVGTTASRTIGIVNLGEWEVRLGFIASGSGRMRVDAPLRLKPQQEALVTLTCDLSDKPIYGTLSDRIRVTINGSPSDFTIYTTAIATDDFSGINRLVAPHCDISPRTYDFGKVAVGRKVQKEVTITNSGRTPLIIRRVAPRPNTTFSLMDGAIIPAGQTIRATITFTITEGYGVVSGGVALTTNDPEMPLQEIRVIAEIKN